MVQTKRRWSLFGRRGSRRPGRHSVGQPYVRVEAGNPDPGDRAAAVLLDRLEPAWTIMYGPWSRRFYALPLFRTPDPLILEATTAQDLTAQIREAERDFLITGGLAASGWRAAA
ncbi:hypothetical protein [Sphaerisporangium album]|uniref:hypothetical protein n=1 Tax=Sphaerisporangium album TaxID=509200 RepID=UPI0015F1223D|nr:hypothetical protein [Sphaerisporangium album]